MIICVLILTSCRVPEVVERTRDVYPSSEVVLPQPQTVGNTGSPIVFYQPPQKEERVWTQETVRILIAEISAIISLFIVGQNNSGQ